MSDTVATSPFVLLSMARSGSYMLTSALNSHPEIKCFGELLKRNPLNKIDYIDIYQHREDADALIASRHDQPIGFVEAAFSLPTPGVRAIGFKLMLGQSEVAIQHFLSDPTTRKILLRRDNVLAAYSSHLVARSTGQGVALTGDSVATPKVEFVAADFERFRKRREKLYSNVRATLAAKGRSCLELEYCDAVRGSAVKRAITYLGVNPRGNFRPLTQKRNPGAIINRFSNPKEVEEYFKGIGFERWLGSEL